MDGIGINGTQLHLTKVPYRKQMCFVFTDGVNGYPVAYVPKGMEDVARKYWQKVVDGVSAIEADAKRRNFISNALNGNLPQRDVVADARQMQADIKNRTLEVK